MFCSVGDLAVLCTALASVKDSSKAASIMGSMQSCAQRLSRAERTTCSFLPLCMVALVCRFGVQASLAGVPSLATSTAAGMPAIPTAVPGSLPGMRPVLAQPPAAAAAVAGLAAAAAGVPGVRPVLAPGAVGGPRPLRLDAAGREVDEAGNVIQAVKVPVATSLVSDVMFCAVFVGGYLGDKTILSPV